MNFGRGELNNNKKNELNCDWVIKYDVKLRLL